MKKNIPTKKTTKKKTPKNPISKTERSVIDVTYARMRFIGAYFTILIKEYGKSLLFLFFGVLMGIVLLRSLTPPLSIGESSVTREEKYWFILHRKSNTEELFFGTPGERDNSYKMKEFIVKTGIPGERPTPLPQLLGKDYWLLTEKVDSSENLETAPYFLKLNVPISDVEPYGPSPYAECNGGDPASRRDKQCNWQLPGEFGLHGVNGDESRLAVENPGSSGCIRHRDEDIIFLYHLLDTDKEIRYYVEDN